MGIKVPPEKDSTPVSYVSHEQIKIGNLTLSRWINVPNNKRLWITRDDEVVECNSNSEKAISDFLEDFF